MHLLQRDEFERDFGISKINFSYRNGLFFDTVFWVNASKDSSNFTNQFELYYLQLIISISVILSCYGFKESHHMIWILKLPSVLLFCPKKDEDKIWSTKSLMKVLKVSITSFDNILEKQIKICSFNQGNIW